MTCEGFGSDAVGICRQEGIAVFVPGMIPGERGRVRIVKPEKRYAYGRLEELLISSECRAVPPCSVYKQCGGCSCQHMQYQTSLSFKRQQVQDLLMRIGGLDIEVPPVIGMENPWHYRNKGTYPVVQVDAMPVCGFYAARSHRLIPLPPQGCLIQREESHQAILALQQWMLQNNVDAYDEHSGHGEIRHLMTRTSTLGQTVVTLICTHANLPARKALVEQMRQAIPTLAGIVLLVNSRTDNVILDGVLHCIWGSPHLEMELCGMQFSVAPQAFFQVNPSQTEKLYDIVLHNAVQQSSDCIVDAYCGAGTISLLLAQHVRHVIGIEIVPQAIENANQNAARNRITNASFLCGKTEVILPKLVSEGLKPDAIVLDPPRKGCEAAVLRAAAASKAERIIYVSCGTPALARDARLLTELGYQVSHIKCVDMFCWTGDVETVCSFSKSQE